MECNILNKLILSCKERGYNYAEATFQRGNYFKVIFDSANSIIEKIQSKFLFLRIIGRDFTATANFALDKFIDVNQIINTTLKNRTSHKDEKLKSSAKEVNRKPMKPLNYLNLDMKELRDWLKSESITVSKKTGCGVSYISYIIEESEVFYNNSDGDFSCYSSSKTHLNSTIININKSNISSPISFYFQDIAPFTSITSKISTPAFLTQLSDDLPTEYIKLCGITHFHRDAVSSILSGMASAFNIDLVISGASFIRISDIGKQLFTSAVNLLDDPLEFDKGRICFSFDMEGTKAFKKTLIKEGVLIDLLCDREKSLLISSLSPGNCFRELPDINLKIVPSNIILSVDICQTINMKVENYLIGTGMQAFFDAGTGRVKGTARGIKKIKNEKKAVNFLLDFSIKDFFNNCFHVDSYDWVNGNYAPNIVTNIKNEINNECD